MKTLPLILALTLGAASAEVAAPLILKHDEGTATVGKNPSALW